MSTAPATPITPTPGIISAYLKAHERLLMFVLFIGLCGWGLQKYYDRASTAATTRATIAESKAAMADQAAATNAALLQQVIQQVQANNAALAAQNQALAQALSARQAAVIIQQKTDTTLPPTALASRIATLSGAPPAEVTIDGANIALAHNAAVAVAQTLEVVPVLKQNLADETTIAENTQKEVDEDNSLMSDYGTQITDLKVARTADAAACKTEVAQVKADSKKNSIKWFKRGFIVGFLGGLWAGHAGL